MAVTLAGCLRNPAADAATAQAVTEIADRLAALQQDNAELQQQVDSLRTVVARQDSVVKICPPLNIELDLLCEGFAILTRAVTEAGTGVERRPDSGGRVAGGRMT